MRVASKFLEEKKRLARPQVSYHAYLITWIIRLISPQNTRRKHGAVRPPASG